MTDTPVVVDTYKARRRLDMGGGKFREYDELVPEAHTWFALEHWLHTGELAEAKDVSEEDFLAAVEQYCPELRDQLVDLVGLNPEVYLEGAHGIASPRQAPMIPQFVPGNPAGPPAVKAEAPAGKAGKKATPTKRARGKQQVQEVTIVATDVAPGMKTPTPSGRSVMRPGRSSEEQS